MDRIRESLLLKMTLIFGGIVLGACLLLGFFSNWQAEKSLEEEAKEGMLKVARQAASTVDAIVQGRIAYVENTANRAVLRGKLGDRETTLEEKNAIPEGLAEKGGGPGI